MPPPRRTRKASPKTDAAPGDLGTAAIESEDPLYSPLMVLDHAAEPGSSGGPTEPPTSARPIPVPTAVAAQWWPCHVQLPGREPLPLAKVFATPQGLYVYNRAPADRHVNPSSVGEPAFFSPIRYDKTDTPRTGYAAVNTGVVIHTADGAVTLTPGAGCGCANGVLKRWVPGWARRSIAWKAVAQ